MEARSIVTAIAAGDAGYVTERYFALIWLLPVIGAGLIVVLIRATAPQQILLAVTLLVGAAFLLQQLRFHYFGSLILTLPPVQWIALQVAHTRTGRKFLGIGASVCFAVMQLPALNSLGTFPQLARILHEQ